MRSPEDVEEGEPQQGSTERADPAERPAAWPQELVDSQAGSVLAAVVQSDSS